jgi:Ca2+/Na+ antiporter
MPIVAQASPAAAATLLLSLGAIGLYVASRAAADALVRPSARPAAGWRALGHWMPIAVVALTAAAFGRADLSLGVVFGTSVAALALATGMITYVARPGELPPSRRAWPFVLAAAILVLIAGFSGHLTPLHAAMLLGLGGAILAVWRGAADDEATVPHVLTELVDADAVDGAEGAAGPRSADAGLRAVQGVLAVALAAAGGWAMVKGAVTADAHSQLLRAGILAAGVLSPLLILPTLATGTDLAQRNRSAEACGTLVGVALLNLCALVPAAVLVWYLRPGSTALGTGGAPVPAWLRLFREGQPMPFPLTLWRIDVVVLVVLGFALIPVSLGRWAIGRLESSGLVLAYAAYLAAAAWVNVHA